MQASTGGCGMFTPLEYSYGVNFKYLRGKYSGTKEIHFVEKSKLFDEKV